MIRFFNNIDIRVHFLASMLLFPLLKMSTNSLFIVAWVICSILITIMNEKSEFKTRVRENHKIVLLTSSIIPLFLISLIYSTDYPQGFKKILQSISLLIIPIVMFFFNKTPSTLEKKYLGGVFVLTCLGHALYLDINFVSQGAYTELFNSKFYNLPFREIVFKLQSGSLHPTYVSLWYSFSCLLLLEYFRATKRIFHKLLVGVPFTFFVVNLLLLSSRIGLISFFIAIAVYIIYVSNRKQKIYATLVLGFLIFMSVTKVSFLATRFIHEFKVTKLEAPIGKRHNSVNLRVGTYLCCIKIFRENPFLGVGLGDVQNSLDTCYSDYNTEVYQSRNYNSHNYYFHILLATGIVGFLFFLLNLIFLTKSALASKDILFVSFLLLIFVSMLSENILSRHHGVVFFAIFSNVFLKSNIKNVNRLLGNLS